MIRLAAVAALLGLGWFLMPYLGLVNSKAPQEKDPEESQFAADRAGGTKVAFDGARAMRYLEAICDLGPRMSGTPGMKKQQDLIRKHFEDHGGKVRFQVFSARQVSQPQPVDMTNIIVSYRPERTRRVILCSHYDTRPIADQEVDPRKWREKFVSANDGGSGVAFLMELAHHMKDLKTDLGVDFVFFDGEEYIFERNRDKYFFGSEHFAKTWQKTNKQDRADYAAAILLDMIAGQKARFPVEGHSWLRAQKLSTDIWRIAAELRCTAFLDRIGERVLDDHIALQNVGIPAIDIIDFEYPHWHRLSDIPDNCDPEGMLQVARVLTTWLQRVK